MNDYYRSYVRVSLDAIAHNIEEVKKRIPPQTKVLAVIKTDAYGHGAVPVARRLHECVDYFAVAELDEALELRNAGITRPILILGYTALAEVALLVKYDITQTVYGMELAKAISAEAVLQKKTAKLHIAADTGMTRIGYVYSKKAVEEILQISRLPGIEIEGMFTHFSCADMKDKTYSNMQRETFEAFLQALLEKGLSIPVVHMYNSAGVMEFDQYPFDMVRSGIVTYGLWPSDEVDKTTLDLHPALEWRAHVVNVKTVPAGVAVSYGATYVTEKETKIATVSVGYGDGYPRSLSSKGRVLVHGHTAQIIGRVCMDQMMVDVTDIPDVRLEDEVTLVGRDGEACITVEELSELSERFNYEFVCDISKRVTRLYV